MKEKFWSKTLPADLFWLFMFGSLVGFVLEGLWCILLWGSWESHTATVWGPFCIVYGIGAVTIYLLSHLLEHKNIMLRFAAFSFAGALTEYFTSLFQELALGCVSWNYDDHFLNIGGRVSLKMTLLWGVLGVVFARFAFPFLKRVFSKMHGKLCVAVCICCAAFMLVNLCASAAAVSRWHARLNNQPPTNGIERILDDTYDNETLEKIYPNMSFADE